MNESTFRSLFHEAIGEIEAPAHLSNQARVAVQRAVHQDPDIDSELGKATAPRERLARNGFADRHLPIGRRTELAAGIAAVVLAAILVGSFAYFRVVAHPKTVAPPITPRAASWTATGTMLTPRSGHTATLLPNGKVLVAGGVNGNPLLASHVLASAELYDPSTGKWSATGNMVTPRAFHTATLLSYGQVLVAGGYNYINGVANAVASAELYDPSTGSWTPTRNMLTPHWGHRATLLNNGKVLVAGGILDNFVMASAELYDPITGTWTATGNRITPRAFQTSTLLPDGKVLVAGGADYTNDVANGGLPDVLVSAEIFNPDTGFWTATRSMAAPRYDHAAVLLLDGKVLVTGGGQRGGPIGPAELYDPSTGTWTATGSMDAPIWSHTATLFRDGTVLMVGYDGAASLYHPATGTWTVIGSIVTGSDATATLLPDGTVLVAGGGEGPRTLGAAELYEPGSPPPAVPLPATGALAPGTYYMANPDLICAGGCSAYRWIIFTLPAGWGIRNGLVYKHLGQPGEVAFSAWTVGQVYNDPCHWQGSALSPLDLNSTTYDAATGTYGLAPHDGGLANQALRGPFPRALTQMTMAGVDAYGGKNFLTIAWRIDLSVPADLDISTCDKGEFRSWTEWHVVDGANSHHAPGQLDSVYMVDVDRRPLVIDASHMPATSQADRAELKAILASMVIDRG